MPSAIGMAVKASILIYVGKHLIEHSYASDGSLDLETHALRGLGRGCGSPLAGSDASRGVGARRTVNAAHYRGVAVALPGSPLGDGGTLFSHSPEVN
jgi:hypothetical protein